MHLKTTIAIIFLLLAGYSSYGSNFPWSRESYAPLNSSQTSIPAYFETQINNTTSQNLTALQSSASPAEKTSTKSNRLNGFTDSGNEQTNSSLLNYLIWILGLVLLELMRRAFLSSKYAFVKMRRWPVVVLLIFFAFNASGQCPTIAVINYCRADGKIELTAYSTGATNYTWNTGATGPSGPSNTTIVPGAGKYSVTVTNPGCSAPNNTANINVGGDVVINGNFTAPFDNNNRYFTTAYAYNNLCTPGHFALPTNANNACNYMYGLDHTHVGGALQPFLAMNSYDNQADVLVWQQILPVKPNTNYYFSLWSMDLGAMDNHPACGFDLRINGVATRFTIPVQQGNTSRTWQHTFNNLPWNSGSNTQVTISITQPYRIAIGGNIGFDDISFSEINPVPLSIGTPAITPICAGNTINLTTTVTGGNAPFTYSWTGPGSFTSTSQNPSISNATAAMSGLYTVTVTDANPTHCTATSSVNVTVNPKPAVTTMTSIVCSAAAFTVTPTDVTNGTVPAGTRYSWPTPTGTGFTGGASGVNTSNISGTLTNTTNAIVTATYTVTPASGAGCPGSTFTVTVTVNPKPAVTNMSSTVCSGVGFTVTPANGTNGTVPAGTTYSWPVPTGTGFTGGAAGIDASSINGTLTNTTGAAVTATYNVTPKSGTCAGSTFTVTVTVNPKPAVVTHDPAAVCEPAKIDLTASAVTANSTVGLIFTYWTDAIATVPLTTPAAVAASGTYYIKGTTAAGCYDIKPVTVTVNAMPTVAITNPLPACSPATVNLTAAAVTAGSTTGLTFTYWTNAGATIALATPAAVSTSGTYFIKGTTAAGCFDIKPVTAVINNCTCVNRPSLALTSNSGITCVSTPITISGNTFLNATTVTITRTGGTGTVSPSASSASPFAFTYTPAAGDAGNPVTITITTDNPNGAPCVAASETYSLVVNPQTTPTFAAVGPYCSGASIPVLPTTSLNNITGTWSPALNNTTTTNYTFTPTAGQCAATATLTIIVTQNITPTFTLIGPLCLGSTPPALPLSSTNSPAITGTWSPTVISTAANGTFPFTFTPDAGQCATTATMNITVNPLPVVPNVPSPPAICANGSASFTVGAGNTWQWQVSTDGFTWADITSAGTNPVYAGYTSATLGLSGIVTSNNGYKYKCRVTDNNTCSSESNAATLTVSPALLITIQPSDQEICLGGSATFNISATGTGTLSYQWETSNNGINWSPIGANSSSLTVPNGIPGTYYHCVVTDACSQLTSNNKVILPYKAPPPVTQPADQTVCESNIAIFSAQALPDMAYQWQVLKTDIGAVWVNLDNDAWNYELGVRSSELFVWTPMTKNGYQYRCVLTSLSTTCSTIGNAATLTISPLPAPPTNLTVDINNFCAYSVEFITLNATGGNGTSVKWYQGSCKGAPLGNSNPITIPAPTTTTTYYASSVNSCGESVSCGSIIVTVLPEPPKPSSLTPGGSLPYSFCSGSLPIPLQSYYLDANGVGSATNFEFRQGGNCGTGTLMPPALTPNSRYELKPGTTPLPTQTTTYYVRTTDGTCWSRCASTTITVYTLPTPPVSVAASPGSLCAGESANITLTATGGDGGTGINPVLKWYSGSCGGTPVGTGTPLTITAPLTPTTYYARWESSCGASTCQNVTVVVHQLPAVTFGGTLAKQCINSTTYTLTGGLPVSGTYSGAGVTGTNFNASVAGTGPHPITYTYTDVNGCTNSATKTITVNTLPTVTFGGTLANQCASSTTYTLTGGLPASGTYSGAGVTGTNFNASDAGAGLHTITYSYTDANGCSNSVANTITVNELPIVTFGGTLANQCATSTIYTLTGGLPAGGTYSGAGVTGTNFNASAAGAGPHTITYTYTDVNGCTNSVTNTITVIAMPAGFSVTGGGKYCSGGLNNVSVGLSGSEIGVNYQLYQNGNLIGSPIPGTGNAILDFGIHIDGDFNYTVQATTSGSNCTITMSGTVNIRPVIVNLYDITGGGPFCYGTGVTIGLSGSQNFTYRYQLYLDSGSGPIKLLDPGSLKPGNGGTINFGPRVDPGIYTVRATYNQPLSPTCETTMNGSVTINALPTITLGANPSVCKGTTTANLVYSSTTGSPNQYSIIFDGAAHTAGFADVTNASLTASPIVLTVPAGAAADIYNATITVRNSTTGCVSITYPILLTVNPIPTISGVSNVCPGEIIRWTGSGTPASSSPWVSATQSVATIDNNGWITGVASGTTSITYTDNNGCSKSKTIQVGDLVTNIQSPTNKSGCYGGNITFNASYSYGGSVMFNWYRKKPDGTITIISSGTIIPPTHSSNLTLSNIGANGDDVDQSQYWVEFGPSTLGCMVSSGIATLTVNTPPTCSITGGVDAVCAGSSTIWSATAGMSSYSWTGPSGFSASTKDITIGSAGTYTVTITDANGCQSTCSRTLIVNPLPSTSLIYHQ